MRFERSSIRSMFGLRFRDATTEQPVGEGLQVTVRRKNGAGSPTRAVRTVSGAYVAQRVTGLRAYERVSEDIPEEIPDDIPDLNSKVPYYVEVRDRRGRFVPELLRVKLPYTPERKYQWLYPVVDPPSEEQIGDSETPEPTVYLFSSVQRPVPSGQAVVYADLEVKRREAWQPAAHAVMRVSYVPGLRGSGGNGNQNEEEVWYGIADAEGRVAVQFPKPHVQIETLSGDENGGQGNNGPPPHDGNGENETNGSGQQEPLSRLAGYSWPLLIRVYYDSSLEAPARTSRPLLTDILNQSSQEPTPIDETTESQSKTLEAELVNGEPLVLATGDRSVLRLAPSGDGS